MPATPNSSASIPLAAAARALKLSVRQVRYAIEQGAPAEGAGARGPGQGYRVNVLEFQAWQRGALDRKRIRRDSLLESVDLVDQVVREMWRLNDDSLQKLARLKRWQAEPLLRALWTELVLVIRARAASDGLPLPPAPRMPE